MTMTLTTEQPPARPAGPSPRRAALIDEIRWQVETMTGHLPSAAAPSVLDVAEIADKAYSRGVSRTLFCDTVSEAVSVQRVVCQPRLLAARLWALCDQMP